MPFSDEKAKKNFSPHVLPLYYAKLKNSTPPQQTGYTSGHIFALTKTN